MTLSFRSWGCKSEGVGNTGLRVGTEAVDIHSDAGRRRGGGDGKTRCSTLRPS